MNWFLNKSDQRWRKLSGFGANTATYGKLHDVEIHGKTYHVLPLVHPRQAARLGAHSELWHTLHNHWLEHTAPTLHL